MPNKPWPEEGTVNYRDIADPVLVAIKAAHNIYLKPDVYEKGIEWEGLDIGWREKACYFSPSERLGASNLRYSHDDQGRTVLAEIINIAVQLGIEQGRRLQMDRQKDIDRMRTILRMCEAEGVEVEEA